MIRILSDDNHLDLVKRAQIKRVEYKLAGRIDGTAGVLLTYKIRQAPEIRLVKLCLKPLFPTLVDPYFQLRIEN